MNPAASAKPVVAPPAAEGQAHPGCLPRGYRLREFVIERVLGDGGFGVVYSALDLRLERRVAIKEYMPSSIARRDTDYSVQMLTSPRHRNAFEIGLRSFINEARLLARFEHPALIKVHQFWQEKGTAYMVMPYYSAPTLRGWVRAQTVPVAEHWLRTFLLSSLEALEVMHAESCLHRDIAPDNILVLNDCSPLLLDFGAARRVIGDLRKALTVIVKPGFAPLEQYADTVKMKQGAWTDVYALAAVAHFVITGHAPAPAVSRVLADEVVPLRERAKGRYSERLLGAIDTALSVLPERRPQSAAAFRTLLQSERPGEWEPTRLIRCGATVAEPVAPAQATVVAAAPAEPVVPTCAPTEVLPRAQAPATIRRRIEAPATLDRAVAAPNAMGRTQRAPATIDRAAATLRQQAQVATMPAAPARSGGTSWATATSVSILRTRIASGLTGMTAAIADTIPPEVRTSPWMGVAGYGLVILGCAGVLAVTAALAERYVESNTRIMPAATVAAPVPAAAPAIEANNASAAQETTPAVAPAPGQFDETEAMASAKPAEVTLAPARIEPLPEAATTRVPATITPAAPAPRASKAKPAHRATVTEIEHKAEPAPAAALMLTAAPKQGNDPAKPGKSRGLDGVLVPLERAAEIAPVAPVQLVVAAAPAPTQPKPLQAIARPRPEFPAVAARAGVREGRVLAQVSIRADGSVGEVDILESRPHNVFDREVRRALAEWRYEAPGQARQTKVEFVFRLD